MEEFVSQLLFLGFASRSGEEGEGLSDEEEGAAEEEGNIFGRGVWDGGGEGVGEGGSGRDGDTEAGGLCGGILGGEAAWIGDGDRPSASDPRGEDAEEAIDVFIGAESADEGDGVLGDFGIVEGVDECGCAIGVVCAIEDDGGVVLDALHASGPRNFA